MAMIGNSPSNVEIVVGFRENSNNRGHCPATGFIPKKVEASKEGDLLAFLCIIFP